MRSLGKKTDLNKAYILGCFLEYFLLSFLDIYALISFIKLNACAILAHLKAPQILSD